MLRTFSRGILFCPVLLDSLGERSCYDYHSLGKYGKLGMRITRGVTQKQCLLWYFFFLVFLVSCSLFCLLSCSWNNTHKNQNVIKMLDDPISSGILGDPGTDSGSEGKSERATKKVGDKKSRALDFSSPTVCFFVFVFFRAYLLLGHAILS